MDMPNSQAYLSLLSFLNQLKRVLKIDNNIQRLKQFADEICADIDNPYYETQFVPNPEDVAIAEVRVKLDRGWQEILDRLNTRYRLLIVCPYIPNTNTNDIPECNKSFRAIKIIAKEHYIDKVYFNREEGILRYPLYKKDDCAYVIEVRGCANPPTDDFEDDDYDP